MFLDKYLHVAYVFTCDECYFAKHDINDTFYSCSCNVYFMNVRVIVPTGFKQWRSVKLLWDALRSGHDVVF